ncbi:hypothetical protein AMAG_05114 [Allomyces macrogynus ATCC 38327]|uniref:Protein phosphatase inhibitor 2 (IPP-2) n=1 Tax=Allomyces macrogynus (strain ATCC 38327) TaxID=578462 RepID=A0A0L0S7A6_ALLM3|nr:hypothetical protein AMAG_05114 [Allomyces macrogynus ATCC 38327]|eukprot:KNE58306.1 hypothetical protein AMAG_05114 [Allomyces macrogynus ATCC 38327]
MSDHDLDHDMHQHEHDAHDHEHGPLRPILKAGRSFERSNAHLRWDEDTIRMHDAERGTRMKIDEPKTPFMKYDASMEDLDGGVPPLELSAAMDVVAASPPQSPQHRRPSSASSDHWTTDSEHDEDHAGASGDEDETPEERAERHRRFEQMRAQHYNMKEALARARWLAEHEDAEANEEDDADNESDHEPPAMPAIPAAFQVSGESAVAVGMTNMSAGLGVVAATAPAAAAAATGTVDKVDRVDKDAGLAVAAEGEDQSAAGKGPVAAAGHETDGDKQEAVESNDNTETRSNDADSAAPATNATTTTTALDSTTTKMRGSIDTHPALVPATAQTNNDMSTAVVVKPASKSSWWSLLGRWFRRRIGLSSSANKS